MKILHFILGKANPDRANGVNQVVYGLAKHQSLLGHKAYVLGISKSANVNQETINRVYFTVEVVNSFYKHGYKKFKEISRDVDIVHFHGVWNIYNIIAARYLRQIGKPYVVTPHCGYASDRLRQSNYYFKLLYHYLLQKKYLSNAAGIHALAYEEMTDILHHCDHKNIFVIPNGIDIYTIEKNQYTIKNREKIKIGYLGRLSAEKNVDSLIRAISVLSEEIKNSIELHLIGPLNKKSLELKKIVSDLGLSDKIIFAGGIYGEDKFKKLSELDFYVHPALSEGFSIALVEVLAVGLPAVITRTSNISYYYDRDIFLMVEPSYYDLARGITEMIALKDKWKEMSQNARNLVVSKLNWDSITNSMLEEFSSILNMKSK